MAAMLFTMLLVVGFSTAPSLVAVPPRPCGTVVRAVAVERGGGWSPSAACPWLADDAQGAVIVRLYQTAHASAPERLHAQAVADQVLASAGVTVDWRFCGGPRGAGAEGDRCGGPPEPAELIVRLDKGRRAVAPEILGFAYVPGVVATVLVDRISETARRSGVASHRLLGAVLAHELTHLLAGVERHSGEGLMRAVWTDRDIQDGLGSAFDLTAHQRQAIAARVMRAR